MTITRQETGWPQHFIMGDRCVFHRGTILRDGDLEVVVSTVGAMNKSEAMQRVRRDLGHPEPECRYEEVGYERHYETMAFIARKNDCGCYGADVSHGISFSAPWSMKHSDDNHDADAMHEAVVAEIVVRMERHEITREIDET